MDTPSVFHELADDWIGRLTDYLPIQDIYTSILHVNKRFQHCISKPNGTRQSLDLIFSSQKSKMCVALIQKLITRYHNISEIRLHGSSITNEIVKTFAEQMPQLKSVALISCHNITDQAVAYIAVDCKKLEKLNLSGCQNITDVSLSLLSDNCPALTLLNVETLYAITDEGITSIAKNCRSLKSLHCASCHYITDESILIVAECCPRLEYLSLFYCDNITDTAIVALAEHCPLLQTLIVSSCYNITDDSVVALSDHCPSLTSLNLCRCTNITDNSIVAITTQIPGLQVLDLSECQSISASMSWASITLHCRQLRELSLKKCIISNGNVGLLAFHGASSLTHLNLNNCYDMYEDPDTYQYIGDVAILSISKYCPNIQYLDISHSVVTHVGLESLAKRCLQLVGLNLSECRGVTNDFILVLTTHCINLQKLNLSWCVSISDISLEYIGRNLHALQVLNLTSVIVSRDAIRRLQQQTPKLLVRDVFD